MLGEGIGEVSGEAIRIAHMGHVNAPMMLGTLGVVETGLGALGIRHGRGGVQAAINFLAEAVPAAALAPSGSVLRDAVGARSEEHTSELQSLMRISYAVFCLTNTTHTTT